MLASKQATGGYEVFLQEGDEGTGPPPHEHAWDESFYVIEGEIEFGIGDDQMTARPGTLVHMPAGTVHWFRSSGNTPASATQASTRISQTSTDR